MNSLELSKKNKQLLESSKLYLFLKDFVDKLTIYPASVFDLKPKQQNQVEKLSETLWSYHIGDKKHSFVSVFNDIKGSLILQGTMNSLPFLVEEVVSFSKLMDNFEQVKKKAKANQHLGKYYTDNFKGKSKELIALLNEELKEQVEKYNFEIEEVMGIFKSGLK